MSDTKEREPDKKKKPIIIRNTVDLQRLKLEKLMEKPDVPVVIPERTTERGVPVVPDFVRNVMGSSAGAGSGEFHVYRHLRRKEYARQKYMQESAERERLNDEYRTKLEENVRKAEERTAKKRAKRIKKKQMQKNKKKSKLSKDSSGSDEENSSENEDNSSQDETQIAETPKEMNEKQCDEVKDDSEQSSTETDAHKTCTGSSETAAGVDENASSLNS